MADTTARSRGRTQRSEVHTERKRSVETIAADIVYFVVAAIDIILAFRFALKLFGANPDAGFVNLVYGLSAPFMAPFEAVFQTQQVEGAVFEWSVLLAIAVYALIGWGIVMLIRAISPRASASTVEHVEHVDATEEQSRQD